MTHGSARDSARDILPLVDEGFSRNSLIDQGAHIDSFEQAISYGAAPLPLLTLLHLAREPGLYSTAMEVITDFGVNQKVASEWSITTQEFGKRIFGNLFRAGLVELKKSRGTATVAAITELGYDMGVPLAGDFLDVMLHSDFSSQRIFGTASHAGSSLRTPVARLRLIEYLQSRGTKPTSLTDVRHALTEITSPHVVIEDLEDADVLRVRNKSIPAHRRIKISAPNPSGLHDAAMRPELIALRSTVSALHRRGIRNMDAQSLIDEVLARHPKLSPPGVRQAVVHLPPSYVRFTDESVFGKGKDMRLQRIDFTESIAPIIPELLRRIDALRNSPTYRKAAANQGAAILNDHEAVALLIGEDRSHALLRPEIRSKHSARVKEMRRVFVGRVSLRRQLTFDGYWRNKAACRPILNADELFFPPDPEDPEISSIEMKQREAWARKVCNACPVAVQCLKDALDYAEEYGIRGGLTANERKQLPQSDAAFLRMVTIRS